MDELTKAQLEVIGKTYTQGIARSDLDFVDEFYIKRRAKEFVQLGLDADDPATWQSDISEIRRTTASEMAFCHSFSSLREAQVEIERQQLFVELSILVDRDCTDNGLDDTIDF